MIIRRIELENFGCYYGTHQIILRCEPEHGMNVIAIGGLNGAGKTTLLDAISFGLFGHEDAFYFIKGWQKTGEDKDRRERRLATIVNRSAFREGLRGAAVTLELLDDETAIEVRRRWEFTDDNRFVREEVDVYQDGQRLTSSEAGQNGAPQRSRVYEDFLQRRLPPNVGRFFVFDGEEIKRLAEADNLSKEITDGIDLLLGFQVLGQLESDLEEHFNRYRRESRRQSRQETDLNELELKSRKLTDELEELNQEELDAEAKNELLRDELRKLNDDLKALMGASGKRPVELQKEYDRCNDEVRQLQKRIESSIEDIALGMPQEVIGRLHRQLVGEEKRRQWLEGQRRVLPQRSRLLEEMFGPAAPPPTPPLLELQSRFLRELLSERWDSLFYPPPSDMADDLRHDYLNTDEELPQVMTTCHYARGLGTDDISVLVARVESLDREMAATKLEMDQLSGSHEEIDSLIERRDFLNREIGENDRACTEARRGGDRFRQGIMELGREIELKRRELTASGASSHLATLAQKARRVVQRFQEALRPKKRDELQHYLREMYRNLARKEDVVQDIELDPETYSVKLFGRDGHPIPLHALSAGEREIFAISLLWGLAQSSRTKLPVIIDTPLGRLDSKHRHNIVQKYLPSAGPQVLVLSTDTELDRKYFEMLDDHIAQKLLLVFDPCNERTSIEDGYFDIT